MGAQGIANAITLSLSKINQSNFVLIQQKIGIESMKEICGVVVLLMFFVGCGGESGGKSENKSNQQSADNKQNSQSSNDGKTDTAQKSAGFGRTDGMFTARANMQDSNKMKMIALGIMNSHDTFNQFPMAPSKGGLNRNEKLSWRVAVLPYLEMSQEYGRFAIDQPWDSDRNKPLASGRGKDPYVLGNGSLVCTIKHKVQPNSFRHIVDGSSNTIMLMENPNAKPEEWTQPTDLTPEDAIKLVKKLKKGEFLLGTFYDGASVKIYSLEGKDIKDKDLEAIFGYNDATPINSEIFQPAK